MRVGPHLVLSGPMGAGKSTIGAAVAARAGLPFADLDAALEARLGKSVARSFAEDGEDAFRRAEAELFAEILARPEAHVVAAGGGTLASDASRTAALERAFVVTLDAPLATLAARIGTGAGRPLAGELEAKLSRRRAAYREAHAIVDAARPVDDVVASVLAAREDPTALCRLGERSYAVRFASDPCGAIRDAACGRPLFPITDANVDAAWGAELRSLAEPIVIPPGERSKRLATVEEICEQLGARGATRDAVVVGVGGGVVTDVAGLAAALHLRGVDWIAVATTVVGAVDAAIGGKTAVDLPTGKNLVGAFHQPRAVIAAVPWLSTEPDRSRRAGLAEIVKTALVGDAALWQALHGEVDLPGACFAAARVKCGIVARDEREAGERALLNLGHTVGHALEGMAGFEGLHGEAVAIGLAQELAAAERLGLGGRLAGAASTLLARIGLSTNLPTGWEESGGADALEAWMSRDKKRRGGRIALPVVHAPGRAEVVWVEVDDFARALREVGRAEPGP